VLPSLLFITESHPLDGSGFPTTSIPFFSPVIFFAVAFQTIPKKNSLRVRPTKPGVFTPLLPFLATQDMKLPAPPLAPTFSSAASQILQV